MSDHRTIPIIRFELEGMKHAILHALTQHELMIDEQVRAAFDAFAKPDNIRRIMDKAVSSEITTAIEKEVRAFFTYGDGAKFVGEAVNAKLREQMEWRK